MSIKIGKIKIKKEIEVNEKTGEILFFKFEQEKKEYYALSFKWAESVGYLGFCLTPRISSLFEKNDFSDKSMRELFKEAVEQYYFISFSEENALTENVEFVGIIDKQDVIKKFNLDK